MDQKSPREFWIIDKFITFPYGAELTCYNEKPHKVWVGKGSDLYHVIEKSAYDDLKELHCFHKAMLDESSIMLMEKNEQLFKLRADLDLCIEALKKVPHESKGIDSAGNAVHDYDDCWICETLAKLQGEKK